MDKALLIGGIVSLSTVDYPDNIAFVIFLQGCSWRCKYCHNKHLQSIELSQSLPWVEILNLLETRKGFVDGVVFSGGEPLIQDILPVAMREVKNMGFKIGLHTGGSLPNMLAKVIPLVDWVGFDVKNVFEEYEEITGVANSGQMALQSLRMLIESNVNFEVRITMHESLNTTKIIDLLKDLSYMGVRTVALQKCRNKDEIVIEHPIFSDKILLEDISKYFDNLFIR
ncbi:MAG: anaerobic ribonucleoside-triphosphate reductase activating protein [Alphaproteobacteria bacterium]|nr:anaerobic ribonucleoside-triphosphate reductase activating protein [Alphaproteobacteria bacterium]